MSAAGEASGLSERLDRILSQKEMPVFEIDRSTIWKRVTVRDHLKEDTGRDRIGPLRRNLRSKVATKFRQSNHEARSAPK